MFSLPSHVAEKRKVYDVYGKDGLVGGGGMGAGAGFGPGFQFHFMNPNDLFRQFFGSSFSTFGRCTHIHGHNNCGASLSLKTCQALYHLHLAKLGRAPLNPLLFKYLTPPPFLEEILKYSTNDMCSISKHRYTHQAPACHGFVETNLC